jgi:hypothetical protein
MRRKECSKSVEKMVELLKIASHNLCAAGRIPLGFYLTGEEERLQ